MITLLSPTIPEGFTEHLKDSIVKSTFSNWGPAVKKLEQKSMKFFSFPYEPLVLCNATLALECALRAMLKKGSMILVPDFTFPATMHSIINADCIPIVADVGPDGFLNTGHFNVDAIVLVTSLGRIPNVKKYEEIAKRQNIPLIIDAAPALGSEFDTYGNCTIFSLHITKTFGIGEGALLLFKDPAHREVCKSVANFGLEDNKSVRAGTNAKMSDIQASVGLALFNNFWNSTLKKKSIANKYYDGLKNVEFFIPQSECTNTMFQVFPILSEKRDEIQKKLTENEIGTRVYYVPLHIQPYFKLFANNEYTNSKYIYDRILCIPNHEQLTTDDINKIINIINEVTA